MRASLKGKEGYFLIMEKYMLGNLKMVKSMEKEF
jgi:hypothetical protein